VLLRSLLDWYGGCHLSKEREGFIIKWRNLDELSAGRYWPSHLFLGSMLPQALPRRRSIEMIDIVATAMMIVMIEIENGESGGIMIIAKVTATGIATGVIVVMVTETMATMAAIEATGIMAATTMALRSSYSGVTSKAWTPAQAMGNVDKATARSDHAITGMLHRGLILKALWGDMTRAIGSMLVTETEATEMAIAVGEIFWVASSNLEQEITKKLLNAVM
jgi:hypothetical protein